MGRLLHINASPRNESVSLKVAGAFLESFRQAHPRHGVERMDLFKADIPLFEAPQASAKYAVLAGQEPKGQDAQAWKRVIDTIDYFKSADLYVLSSPMWNFGIPYRLKQYIDVLVQPALTFSYSPREGYKGLVVGKPAMLVLARGGAYGTGNPNDTLDFQMNYLETILRFIGFTDIRSIVIDGTLQALAMSEKAVADALALAQETGIRWP